MRGGGHGDVQLHNVGAREGARVFDGDGRDDLDVAVDDLWGREIERRIFEGRVRQAMPSEISCQFCARRKSTV